MDKFIKRTHAVLYETDESCDNSSSEINEATPTTTSGKCSAKNRKYDEDYLQYGFIESVSNPGRPQCMICNKVLSNEAMKPTKLKRHLTKQHAEVQHKPKDYFLRKETGDKQQAVLKMALIPNEKALKASHLVAQRVARAKNGHTIAEELILAAAFDMCEAILGKENCAKLKTIPLSNNTISRRITDMSNDIKTQLTVRLRDAYYAIQLDDSTDFDNQSHLLVYVRYCWEGEMLEDFLMCHAMSTRATGEEVFKVLKEFWVCSH